MLNRLKLIEQVKSNCAQFTKKQINRVELAIAIWNQVATDSSFKTSLLACEQSFNVAGWHGDLGQIEQFINSNTNCTVIASDGSQIYPDRHMGSNHYLINIGISVLHYGHNSWARFSNEPFFFASLEDFEGSVVDYIDSKRHELETQIGLISAINNLNGDVESSLQIQPLIYLADGSLIAWHLFGKGESLQNKFFPTYLQQLKDFKKYNIPSIGYISLPNSTDIINILRIKLNNFNTIKNVTEELSEINDADLMWHILRPLQVTTWFKSNVAAAKIYPVDLQPYFAYFNTGNEIARIEAPSWIVKNNNLLKQCMQIIVDQVCKGYGYPVVLAEAHQQAVIKADDRDFFYQIINQVNKRGPNKANMSRKLRQKQNMHI